MLYGELSLSAVGAKVGYGDARTSEFSFPCLAGLR